MLQLSADLGTDIDVTSTERIGKENENGEQLILVPLTSELQAQNILKLAKKLLKEFEHYKNIYIKKDLTKSKQLENKKTQRRIESCATGRSQWGLFYQAQPSYKEKLTIGTALER